MAHEDLQNGRLEGTRLLSGSLGQTRRAISADIVLASNDSFVHFLDPGASTLNVTLPPFATNNSAQLKIISNTSTTGGILNVKDTNAVLIATVNYAQTVMFVGDGISWTALGNLFGPAGTSHGPGVVPDPGVAVPVQPRYLDDSGNWSSPSAEGFLKDAYTHITDGTNTANASGADTFRFRSGDSSVAGVVANNDPTFGDSINLQVDPTHVDHDLLLHWVANKHIDHTAVSLTLPNIFTGGNGDISASRTWTLSNQNANLVFAGPTSGVPATPSFRALVATDIPALSYVTSVGLSLPASVFAISGSPVTSSGTLTATFQSQSANLVFASPNGLSGTPTFRALVAGDLPASGVTAATYGDASHVGQFTVQADGIITFAQNVSIAIDASGVISGNLNISRMPSIAAYTLLGNPTNASAMASAFTIDALTAKATPVGADEIPIWDVAGAAMKKATITNVVGAVGVSSYNTRTGAVTAQNSDFVPFVRGGYVNVLRNPGMDIAQRSTSVSVTTGNTAYTLDGWMVSATGATAVVTQQYQQNLAGNALRIACATGLTACTLQQRIESYMAAALLAIDKTANTCTFKAEIYNNTGASLTVQLATDYANAQDNFSAVTADLAATNLQTIANGARGVVAYTFNPNANLANGYQVRLLFGGQLNAATGYVEITRLDLRQTVGVSTGLNSSPQPTELRPIGIELPLNYRYLWTTYDLGVAPGTNTALGAGGGFGINTTTVGGNFPFGANMCAIPTIILYSQVGTSGKWSSVGGIDTAAAAASGIGRRGFLTVGSSGLTANAFYYGHVVANAEL